MRKSSLSIAAIDSLERCYTEKDFELFIRKYQDDLPSCFDPFAEHWADFTDGSAGVGDLPSRLEGRQMDRLGRSGVSRFGILTTLLARGYFGFDTREIQWIGEDPEDDGKEFLIGGGDA